MPQRAFLIISLVFVVVTFTFAESGMEGQKAPDFSLKRIDGEKVKLSDYLAEGPVLLDFWATWCVPCKQAIIAFAKLHETYKESGFNFVAISTDNTKSVNKVRPYARSQKWEFDCLLDTDNEVLKRYRGNSVPHTVLVGKDGTIARIWIGYHPGEEKEIEEEIIKLLGSDRDKTE